MHGTSRDTGVIAGWFYNHIDLATDDSPAEERVNAITHGAGLLMAALATILLVRQAVLRYTPAVVVAYLVFGITMMLTYAASTAYHSATGPLIKRVTRLADHLSIFLLIAGTYTAILARLNEPWTTWVFITIWALAAGGIISTLVFWQRFKVIHVGFYLAMGWLIVVKLPALIEAVSRQMLVCMIIAGLSYSLGTIVYGLRGVAYHHAVWHLFVISGSASFFVGIYFFL